MNRIRFPQQSVRNARKHPPRLGNSRRGATIVEMALVLTVFITLVLGTLDIGIVVYRHHVLSHAARDLARTAIVHGALADRLGAWGPEPFVGTAADPGDIPRHLRGDDVTAPKLAGMDPGQVTVSVTWPEGNGLHAPTQVVVSTTYQPIVTFVAAFFGVPPLTISATSQMQIAH